MLHEGRHSFTLYYCHNIAMISCENRKTKGNAIFFFPKTEICNFMHIQTAKMTEQSVAFVAVVAEKYALSQLDLANVAVIY